MSNYAGTTWTKLSSRRDNKKKVKVMIFLGLKRRLLLQFLGIQGGRRPTRVGNLGIFSSYLRNATPHVRGKKQGNPHGSEGELIMCVGGPGFLALLGKTLLDDERAPPQFMTSFANPMQWT